MAIFEQLTEFDAGRILVVSPFGTSDMKQEALFARCVHRADIREAHRGVFQSPA